jgi:hypothetical protein
LLIAAMQRFRQNPKGARCLPEGFGPIKLVRPSSCCYIAKPASFAGAKINKVMGKFVGEHPAGVIKLGL